MAFGGGAIWSIAAASASAISIGSPATAEAIGLAETVNGVSNGPYRPSEWQNAPLVTVTVPGTATTFANGSTSASGSSAAINSGSGQAAQANPNVPGGFVISLQDNSNVIIPPTVYVFDAVIRTEHQQRIEKTQDPIQTGANISDHAFIMPARVVLEIGMSDAMDSYTPGQWSPNRNILQNSLQALQAIAGLGSQGVSKSVNAYQTMLKVAKARGVPGPLTVTTRLNTYTNMLLTDISAPDTAETKFGLRATLVFEELFTGTVTSQQVSARTDLTGATNLGTKQALPVPSTITQQNVTTQPTTVPAAGVISSNPISNGS
jgi:hypothetical protein